MVLRPSAWRQDISVALSHADIDVLARASQAFLERVEAFEETRDVSDNYNKGKAQFDFVLRPEGRHLGLTAVDVGSQVRDAFYGALAMRQLRGTDEIEMRVKLPLAERKDIRHLEDFVIRTPDGTEVPLMDVVRIERGEAFTSINRRDGRRVVTVGMNVEPKRAMTRVLEAIKLEELPRLRADFPGITWTFQGTQAEMRESTQALWGGFALAMAVVYMLLAIAFGSYIQPLIVMAAIPFGIVGAVIGHILLGYDLSLISLMGVIALSGVVVKRLAHHGRLRQQEARRPQCLRGHPPGRAAALPADHPDDVDHLRRPDAHHPRNLPPGLLPDPDGHIARLRHHLRDLHHTPARPLPLHDPGRCRLPEAGALSRVSRPAGARGPGQTATKRTPLNRRRLDNRSSMALVHGGVIVDHGSIRIHSGSFAPALLPTFRATAAT